MLFASKKSNAQSGRKIQLSLHFPERTAISLLAAFLMGAVLPVHAAICWTGTASGKWNDSGNWSGTGGYLYFTDISERQEMEWTENLTKFTYIDPKYKALYFRYGTADSPFVLNGNGYTYNNSSGSDAQAVFYMSDEADSALWFYNGTLKTKRFTAGTAGNSAWLKVGNGSDGTTIANTSGSMVFANGTMILDKATVSPADSLQIGSASGVAVSLVARDATLSGDLKLGLNESVASLAIDGGTFEISSGKWTRLEKNGVCTMTVGNGGTLKTQCIYDDGAASASLLIDGGTLAANEARYDLVPASVPVAIGANGATIDAGGFDVTVSAPVADATGATGALAMSGGGSVALAGGNSYTGTTTVADGTALSTVQGAVALAGPVVLSAGAKIKVSRSSPKALCAVSATLPGAVVVDFDEESFTPGDFPILTLTGQDETFSSGDLEKFSLGANAPEASFSLSSDAKSIVLSIDDVNPAEWTGKGDGKSFSDPANWRGKAVPCELDDVVVAVSADKSFVCDVALSVKSFTVDGSGAVSISGTGSITLEKSLVNSTGSRMVADVPVEFKADDAYAPVDATGEVEFGGGVTGTLPVNHSTLFGAYTLTTKNWTLSAPLTLAAGATVAADSATLDTNGSTLSAEAGSTLTIDAFIPKSGSNPFASFAGTMTVRQIYPQTNAAFTFNEGFAGVLRVKQLYRYCGNTTMLTFSPASTADVVVGGGTTIDSVEAKRGTLFIGGCTFKSSADWAFNIINNNPKKASKVDIGSAGIVVDTSDYDDATAAGHTVAVRDDCTHSDDILTGTGGLTVLGNGTLRFDATAKFTGGLTARDSATVEVKAGAHPGKGAVALQDAATLSIPDSGTAAIDGTLSFEAGTTLAFGSLDATATAAPLSIGGSIEMPSAGTVRLDTGVETVSAGIYKLVSVATLPAAADLEKFDLSGVKTPRNYDAKLGTAGDAVVLKVVKHCFHVILQ